MHTNVEQEGTKADDFNQFLVNQIDEKYVAKRVPIHNGNQLMAINHFIRQVYYDLESNILPILLINGYLPSFGDTWFHYLIINGIHGDILRPITVNFEYTNTRPGNRDEGTFGGYQLSLLWKDNMGCYFGKNHDFH